MLGIPPTEFLLYYAGGLFVLILVLFWRRPRGGMRLRFGTGRRSTDYKNMMLRGRLSPDMVPPRMRDGERNINVIFNFNGESWDAYEVFGLPAGSGLSTVEVAYHECLERVDESSRPFLHAAFKAIQESLSGRRISS